MVANITVKKAKNVDPERKRLMEKTIAAKKSSMPQNYFRAGDSHERTMQGWNPRLQSADLDLNKFKNKMTARVRDLVRNNGYAQSVTNTYIDNSVGHFFKVSPQINYQLLGRDFKWAHDLSRNIKARFNSWAESSQYSPDFYRQNTFAELLKQAVYSTITTGECFALVRYQAGSRYRLKVQFIEPERVSTPKNRKNDKSIVDGIQLNKNGQVIGYWVQTTHPSASGTPEWRFIPRVNRRGRKQVIHIYDQERPEQRRGRSIFASIVQQFKLLDNYKITESERAIAQAMFAAVIQSDLPSTEAFAALGGPDEDELTPYESFMYNLAEFDKATGGIKLNGSKIAHLATGEKLNIVKSEAPNSVYGTFTDAQLREIAAGSGPSYEQISRDFSKTSYASARTAMIESWKRFENFKSSCPAKLASEIYFLWLEEDLDFVSGYPDASVARFADFPEAWSKASWMSPGKGEIDPLKSSQAAENNLRTFRTTHTQEAADLGRDFDELLDQRAFEKNRMQDLGLSTIEDLERQPIVEVPNE